MSSNRSHRCPARTVRPCLEALEDRCVPNVSWHGGPVLTNVQVENIFWGSAWTSSDGQQMQGRLNNYIAYLTQSPYMDMLSEYTGNALTPRVGRGQLHGSMVYLPNVSGQVVTGNFNDPSNILTNVLVPNILNGNLPALPSLNNLYIIYLPPGVTNDFCVNNGDYAYHGNLDLSKPPYNIPTDAPVPNQVQFVIVPYPDGSVNALPHGLTNSFDGITLAVSHELAETVTDPNLIWANQYAQVTQYGSGWYTVLNIQNNQGQLVPTKEEIGDLAQGYAGVLNGYLVQAEWSNALGGITLPPGVRMLTLGQGYSTTTGADSVGKMVGPSGRPDFYTIPTGGTLIAAAFDGVLANDSDPFNNPLQAVLAAGPSHGRLTLNSNGSFTYPPNAGFVGVDTFTYQPSDGTFRGDPVTVTINVRTITGLSLSNTAAAEFRPVGTAVGTFATTETAGLNTFNYYLVSGAGSTDNASFTIRGNQLLTADAFDFAAKSAYSIRVRTVDQTGLSFDQTFTITVLNDPALTRSGRTLTVSGGAGNDAFSFAPGAAQDSMVLNGVALAVDAASVDTVAFNGGGGSDSATLFAGGGANTLNLVPGGGSLSGPGYQVTVSGVAQVVAAGHAGDRAYLTGSAGNDTFVGTPSYVYLRGPGYFEQADGFGVALAYGAGGSDTAYLYGSASNDVFVGTPTYSYLYGSGFWNQVNGFAVVVGTAGEGGTDQAYLYGAAAGGNAFVGTPTYAYLYGGGFWNQANGFQVVVGNSAGPNDSAYLYDSPGSDVFVGTSSYSYLYGAGFFNQANGFAAVYAYSTGGADQAYLYGSMTAADTSGQAGGYAYLYGNAFFELVNNFSYVYSNPYAHS